VGSDVGWEWEVRGKFRKVHAHMLEKEIPAASLGQSEWVRISKTTPFLL